MEEVDFLAYDSLVGNVSWFGSGLGFSLEFGIGGSRAENWRGSCALCISACIAMIGHRVKMRKLVGTGM